MTPSSKTVISVSHNASTLSAAYAYTLLPELKRGDALKIRCVVTAGGGGLASVLVSVMDASTSSSTTINDGTSATYDGIVSTLQSSGAEAVEHTIAAGRGVIVCVPGGLCDKVAIRYKANAATAPGDAAVLEVTVGEETH